MAEEFHISSLVIHARPEALEAVSADLAGHGLELHAQSPEGKLVATLETESEGEIVTCLSAISRLPGVLAATLVFHHCEPVGESLAEQD